MCLCTVLCFAADEENLLAMCEGELLAMLIKKVHSNFDPLLMKFIRNLSETKNDTVQRKFTRHLHELVGMAVKTQVSVACLPERCGKQHACE